ncbi:MAG TPA: SH3 domain-containing protein [Devosia sp.]|nr:SH3 domain-containing protein [Devosia sp.]
MSVLLRLLAGFLLALSLAVPAAAVQPLGSAGWTTDGWTNFSGTLYHGPGTQYDVTGHVDAGIRIRVDRCSQLWCFIHTRDDRGWMSLSNISFGQGPWQPFVNTPKLPVRYGGGVCFYSGADYSGRETCYAAGHVIKDLYLAGLDNSFRSVRISGGSVLACRDRNFRSYCVILNESKPRLEGLLTGAITSIRVY